MTEQQSNGVPVRRHPDALTLQFRERVNEYGTGKLYSKLERNLRRQEVAYNWDEYMDILDSVKGIRAEAAENNSVTLSLRFESNQKRQHFNALIQKIFSGTSNPGLFFFTDDLKGKNGQPRPIDPYELSIHNFGHEDLATLGRVATALFNAQYGKELLQNLRLVNQDPLHTIEEKGLESYLPEAVRTRIIRQKTHLGEIANTRLLTSGVGISLIGIAVREALKASKVPLKMQRDPDARPAIERKLDFRYHKSKTPGSPAVSGTTLGRTLLGHVEETADDLGLKHFKNRDVPGIGESVGGTLYDLATGGVGGLVPRAGGSVARMAVTTVEGTVAALKGFIEDKQIRRRQEGRPSWRQKARAMHPRRSSTT